MALLDSAGTEEARALGGPERSAGPLRPGLLVAGRFELIEKMGAGGFGEVWRARHTNLGIDVALKLLCADAASHNDLAAMEERFRFEAQVSALVGKKTAHVVAVHDAGVSEVGPFLAMELVVGRSLEAMIDDGPLAVDALVPLLAELGEALDASHAAGIVHRDLKPANVLLAAGAGPKVKLIDFGIAKATGDVGDIARPKQTDARFFVGTPEYMSPEQVRTGASVSAASDLWALGILAYEALTATVPFGGKSAAETMVRISEACFTPPSRTRSEITPALDAWFARALARDPGDRFESGREAAQAFATAARGRLTPARRSLPSLVVTPPISILAPAERTGRGGWFLAAAAACLVVGTLIATGRAKHAALPVARPGLAPALAHAAARAASFALAPSPRVAPPADTNAPPKPALPAEPPHEDAKRDAPRPFARPPRQTDPSGVF